jgi:hypothetical protein
VKTADSVDVFIPSQKANLYAFVLFACSCIAFGTPFIATWGLKEFFNGFRSFLTPYYFFIVVIVGGVVVHEMLHALTWVLVGKAKLRRIRFGFDLKNMAPYVHCEDRLSVSAYVAGTLMPGLILGLVPAAISVFSANAWLLWFGIFFTAGAASDFYCVLQLRRFHNSESISDHPSGIGFTVHKRMR